MRRNRFLRLSFFAEEFGVSIKHLQNVSLAQRGRYDGHHFSDAALARYPKFVKGPGGLGLWERDYEAFVARRERLQEAS